MARNADFTLSPAQQATADKARNDLGWFVDSDAVIRIDYVKRNGEAATLIGQYPNMAGKGSHEVVTLETEKGYRSANLWAITEISVPGRK